MTITLENWKEVLRKAIRILPDKYKKVGITSLYTIVASSAILPVAFAGEEWRIKLGTMIAGVGANLIANLVQDAKDEIDVARKIEGLSSNDPVHKYIQDLLNKLDAISIARQGLPESDWDRLEALLDSKFAGLSLQQPNFPLSIPALKLNITSSGAREKARKWIEKNWWIIKRPIQRLSSHLIYETVALYTALIKIEYSGTIIIPENKEANTLAQPETKKKMAGPKKVSLIFYPVSLFGTSKIKVIDELLNAVNGHSPKNNVSWEDFLVFEIFYKFVVGFKKVVIIILKSIMEEFTKSSTDIGSVLLPNLDIAKKRFGFWKSSKYIAENYSPYQLPITVENKLLGEAHAYLESQVSHAITNTLGSIEHNQTFYLTESIVLIRYPFWSVDTITTGPLQLIIDGISGDVLYGKGPARKITKSLLSIATILVVAIIILIIAGLISIFQ